MGDALGMDAELARTPAPGAQRGLHERRRPRLRGRPSAVRSRSRRPSTTGCCTSSCAIAAIGLRPRPDSPGPRHGPAADRRRSPTRWRSSGDEEQGNEVRMTFTLPDSAARAGSGAASWARPRPTATPRPRPEAHARRGRRRAARRPGPGARRRHRRLARGPPVDRLDDALLLADVIAAHAPGTGAEGRIELTLDEPHRLPRAAPRTAARRRRREAARRDVGSRASATSSCASRARRASSSSRAATRWSSRSPPDVWAGSGLAG